MRHPILFSLLLAGCTPGAAHPPEPSPIPAPSATLAPSAAVTATASASSPPPDVPASAAPAAPAAPPPPRPARVLWARPKATIGGVPPREVDHKRPQIAWITKYSEGFVAKIGL